MMRQCGLLILTATMLLISSEADAGRRSRRHARVCPPCCVPSYACPSYAAPCVPCFVETTTCPVWYLGQLDETSHLYYGEIFTWDGATLGTCNFSEGTWMVKDNDAITCPQMCDGDDCEGSYGRAAGPVPSLRMDRIDPNGGHTMPTGNPNHWISQGSRPMRVTIDGTSRRIIRHHYKIWVRNEWKDLYFGFHDRNHNPTNEPPLTNAKRTGASANMYSVFDRSIRNPRTGRMGDWFPILL